MKKISDLLGKIGFTFFLAFSSMIAFAQDKDIDVSLNVDKGGGEWYKQIWVWVVGGAVFILLLVALLRGGKKS